MVDIQAFLQRTPCGNAIPSVFVALLLSLSVGNVARLAKLDDDLDDVFESLDYSKAGKGHKTANKSDKLRIKSGVRTIISAAVVEHDAELALSKQAAQDGAGASGVHAL